MSAKYSQTRSTDRSSTLIAGRTSCDNVTCQRIACGKDSSPTLAAAGNNNNGSCCPVCTCNPCADLDYDICAPGFKPAKQIRAKHECCDTIVCISDTGSLVADADQEVSYLIGQMKHNEQQQQQQQPATADKSMFVPSNVDDEMNDDEEDAYHEEMPNEDDDDDHNTDIDEGDDDDESASVDEHVCAMINCSDYVTIAGESLACPADSKRKRLSHIEQSCCGVESACVCDRCEPRATFERVCRMLGEAFEPVLIQQGRQQPGTCCNVYTCSKRKTNIAYFASSIFSSFSATNRVCT